ncbi:MAG: vitamin K epoxide reductase family protein [Planctomycetota bacterium]|nr:vitamin K epoxide reductase family protein [Planctomycetota bacterium]
MQDQSRESQDPDKQNSVPWFQLALMALSIIGATLTLILIDIHAQNQLGLIPSAAFCGPEDACNSLAVSPYSRFIGIPLAFWGLAYYLGNLALALGVRSDLYNTERLLKTLTALALLSLLVDTGLGSIMIMEESLCFLCLGTYAVNLGILISAALARRRLRTPGGGPNQSENVLILAATAVAVLVLLFGLTLNHYLGAAKKLQVQSYLLQLGKPVSIDLPAGESLGPKEAKLKMVIFHDYLCAHCTRLRRKARILRRRYPETLSIRFINYPLDKQCNSEFSRETGACDIAAAALVADSAKRLDDFVRLSNARKLRKKVDLEAVMAELKLDVNTGKENAIQERLKAEIKLGKDLKIRRLPTFFINGYRFEGVPSIEGFSTIFEHIERRGSS